MKSAGPRLTKKNVALGLRKGQARDFCKRTTSATREVSQWRATCVDEECLVSTSHKRVWLSLRRDVSHQLQMPSALKETINQSAQQDPHMGQRRIQEEAPRSFQEVSKNRRERVTTQHGTPHRTASARGGTPCHKRKLASPAYPEPDNKCSLLSTSKKQILVDTWFGKCREIPRLFVFSSAVPRVSRA